MPAVLAGTELKVHVNSFLHCPRTLMKFSNTQIANYSMDSVSLW
jgi:hypothetical protein